MVSPKDMDRNPIIESLNYKMPDTVQVKIPENAMKIHRIEGPDKEDIAFDAPENATGEIVINAEYVQSKLKEISTNLDLSRYIL